MVYNNYFRRRIRLSSLGTAVALSPVVLWALDSVFSIHRIVDNSMEPTLSKGDLVVVRKAEGFWQRWTRPLNGDENHHNNIWLAERSKILNLEKEHCQSNGAIGLLRKPPVPITGDIIVYKDPHKYPDRLNVKRVTALGGQTVRQHSNKGRHKSKKLLNSTVTVYVPPYKLWVESDKNLKNPRNDLCVNHGLISKKLLVGVVEYRLWPFWRKVGKPDRIKIEQSNI